MQQTWLKAMAAATIAGLLLAGCGQAKMTAPNQTTTPPAGGSQGTAGQTNTGQPVGEKPPAAPPAANSEQTKQAKVKVYFGDAQMEKLVEKEASISYKQDSDKYLATLKAQSTDGDAALSPLFKGFTFKSATLKDGKLTVDLSMAPESRLGSGGEEMVLSALQKSLFQFSEVQSIDILLDGKPAESLMGHMELPHPIKRGSQ